MKYRLLGTTGLNVSVIGLGTHQFSGEWAKQFTEAEVRRIVGRAHNLGINLIDTAECYGDHTVESLLGNSLPGNRQDWNVATKFGHRYCGLLKTAGAWSPSDVLQQLEDSLRALRTDYVDIYQFHSGSNTDFDDDSLWKMLNEQVRLGKVRHLGVSIAGGLTLHNDTHQLKRAREVGATVIQTVYNRLKSEAERDFLPFAQNAGLGVLARVPLAKGFLSGRYHPGATFAEDDIRSTFSQEFNDDLLRSAEEIKRTEVPAGANMAQWALAWCLRNSAVSAVIVGSKNEEQLQSNAEAADLVI
jgi:myo-inositol catabolism protein IolS